MFVTRYKQKHPFFVFPALPVCLLILFLCACGIDNYIYLYPVTTYLNWPDTNDEIRNYCAFRTSDTANNSSASGYFQGFEVYYRIYRNLTTLESERLRIDSYNEDESTQAMAFDYMTSTYNYKRLAGSHRLSEYPLIPGASSNRDVYIRLYNTVNSSITAGIKVYESGENSTLLLDCGIPRRTVGGITRNNDDYSFKIEYIKNGDDDVSWSSTTTEDGKLYAQFYVAAYGYDESFQSIYSELFSLGYITLDADYENR